MEHRQTTVQAAIDPGKYGVSFSLPQCRNFGVDPHEALDWLLAQGWRRFRLMSYWNLHERSSGDYDFSELDWQLDTIRRADGEVSLSLGVKQPRWPEYHWPRWAWELPKPERDKALLRYVEQVVNRYRQDTVIISWQLENEALLSNFGERIEIDRDRLHREYSLVKRLDTAVRPIIMSTSNGWGIPLRGPVPDLVGFSYYPVMYQKGKYRKTVQKPWLHRLRTHFVHVLLGKQVFIHELQCEPWGPTAIWKMDAAEQAKSMDMKQIQKNIKLATKTKLYPVDFWGAEWWYWRHTQGDDHIWATVDQELQCLQ